MIKKAAYLTAAGLLTTVSPWSYAATATATFQVLMTVQSSCTVAAGAGSNINLGTVPSNSASVNGSSTISVTCSNTTPYNVALSPSNGNTVGAGVMSSTGGVTGNTDQVPYILHSTSATGPVWGNSSVTATSTGNGVSGTGNGAAQTLTVYAVAPGANYIPDTYADTVTVIVNY